MSNPYQKMLPIPETQSAIQLTGAEVEGDTELKNLVLNPSKPVPKLGPHDILLKVECAGLCASDNKLLKQFSGHARKGDITKGIFPEGMLDGMSSYVPANKPTVPGHEVTARVVAVGSKVKDHKVGERYIVQADYRELKTKLSNGAFGYDFEGGLQEYVAVDERVVTHKGKRFLIKAPEHLSAATLAMVEPWTCVEASYTTPERRTIKPGGKLLIVSDANYGHSFTLQQFNLPFADKRPEKTKIIKPSEISSLPMDDKFDDIVYYGADKKIIEELDKKLAKSAIMNIVLGGRKIGKPVDVNVRQVHYGLTRWIGTEGNDAGESYKHIPETGELRTNDHVAIIGADGPMGQMHTIRARTAPLEGLSIVGTGHHDDRIAALTKKARAGKAGLRLINTHHTPLEGDFSYWVLNVDDPTQVTQAVAHSKPGSIINIFAGYDEKKKNAELDLDAYIKNKSYMFGTSGSLIEDMQGVLDKVVAGRLEPMVSIDAISGMAGAREGLKAVKGRKMAGKSIVFPWARDMELIQLSQLHKKFPTVAEKLKDGEWTKAAEDELHRVIMEERKKEALRSEPVMSSPVAWTERGSKSEGPSLPGQ